MTASLKHSVLHLRLLREWAFLPVDGSVGLMKRTAGKLSFLAEIGDEEAEKGERASVL